MDYIQTQHNRCNNAILNSLNIICPHLKFFSNTLSAYEYVITDTDYKIIRYCSDERLHNRKGLYNEGNVFTLPW
jgi:hypothetical protein